MDHKRFGPSSKWARALVPLLATLSAREREIFDLLLDGLRLAQVAQSLFISRETVRNHLKAIFHKLDVHSQTELIGKGRGLVR